MTKKEIKQKIKTAKDTIRLAQLYKDDFVKELGVVGYVDFIDEKLEELKYYLDLLNK